MSEINNVLFNINDGSSEEALIIQYKNTFHENKKDAEKTLIDKILELWKNRIKIVNFRVWSYCRKLAMYECAGGYDSYGNLFEPSYLGLLSAVKNYDGKRKFGPYAWKTITGKCQNYCVRECYKGLDIINKLPEKISIQMFENLSLSNKLLEKNLEILKYCYKLNKDKYYSLIRNNLSIKKAIELSMIFNIDEEDFDNIQDNKKNNFLYSDNSILIEIIDKIIIIIKNDLDAFYRMIIYYFFIKKLSQKEICDELHISEPSLTRKIYDIEEQISAGLLKYYPESLPDKIEKINYEKNIINRMKDSKYVLNKKEKDLLNELFDLENGFYILKRKNDKSSIMLKKILTKTGFKSRIKFRDLKDIEYFNTIIGNVLKKNC
jgi:RNA polymerase sigma factor (sigma-70 family)